MSRLCWVLLGLVGTTVPAGFAAAQVLHHGCCSSCSLPATTCVCQSVQPIVETSYRQQQVVTYQNVAETHLRQENVVQRVPVTRVSNVTVDEGAYQMVWVPRPVTRQVATTECIDQVVSRTVPVTVQRTVPQITTHLVPQQTVRYVTQQHAVAVATPTYAYTAPAISYAPPVVAQRPFCPSCAAPPFTTSLPSTGFSNVAALPTSTHHHHHAVGSHLIEQPRLPHVALGDGPTPDPHFSGTATNTAAADGWSTIGRRQSPMRTATRQELYNPTPSAAAVWQGTGSIRR
jgi:hypothetical protein